MHLTAGRASLLPRHVDVEVAGPPYNEYYHVDICMNEFMLLNSNNFIICLRISNIS